MNVNEFHADLVEILLQYVEEKKTTKEVLDQVSDYCNREGLDEETLKRTERLLALERAYAAGTITEDDVKSEIIAILQNLTSR